MFDTSILIKEKQLMTFSRDTCPYQKYKKEEILLYDHFVNPNGYEVIILPEYTNVENIKLLKNHNFIVVSGQSCILAYKLFEYSNCTKSYNLAIMTLFYYETNEELNSFYDYYTEQGVDHFFMYYNGNLEMKKDLPQKENVSYLSWDFDYWRFESDYRHHHAQIPAMLHFTKKYLPTTKYSMMIDIDELVSVDGFSIKEYLNKNSIDQNLFLKHHWGHVDFKNRKITYLKAEPNRGKTILSSSACDIQYWPDVHRSPNAHDSDICMFHDNPTKHFNFAQTKTENLNEKYF